MLRKIELWPNGLFFFIMAIMLPTPTLTVKSLLKEQALIWGIFGGTALIFWLTGADTALARTIYHPKFGETGDNWAWFLRQYASWPAILLALGGLVALMWPRLWRTRPLLYKTALVMALATILGAGLLNQIVIKNLADRPRPRESVLINEAVTSNSDSFRGNSMPSGHAAMGFALVAPFFPLRRHRPRLAYAFLTSGLALGFTVGFSRMVLGAHFLSDVLIAAALALATAHLLTVFTQRFPRLPHTALALVVLLMGTAVILGNRFTNQTFQLVITQPFNHINLPCAVETLPTTGLQTPILYVKLNGYGAPLSNLKLIQNEDTISLRTTRGLYHHLTCTATLGLPDTE